MTAALGTIFYWLLSMSAAASLAGCAVLALRLIKPMPRRLVAWLWAAPYIRMCLPVGLNSPVSLMRLLSRFSVKTVTVFRPVEDLTFSAMNTVGAAQTYFPMTYRVNVLEPVFGAAGWIWLAGAAGLLAFFAVAYRSGMRESRGAVPRADGIRTGKAGSAAAVFGILRPVIVLPARAAAEDERYVLLHEKTHIRRRDNLRRAIAFVLTAAHWFNPLAWLFLNLYLADLELACDEQAAAKLTAEEKRAYTRALVNAAPRAPQFASPFGGAGLRIRVERLMTYRGAAGVSLAFFALLAASVLLCLLTNAAGG